MPQKTEKITWKPIKINSEILKDAPEGLVGIEECTDYNLNDFETSKPKRKSKTGSKVKRKKQKTCHTKQILLPSTKGTTNQEEILTDYGIWTSFGLPQPILQSLASLGFKEPTQIQSLTLPAAILGRRDILGAAETGSGKTLAFGLPILSGILEMKKNKDLGLRPLYALILTPTRELALQISDHLRALAKYTDINIAVLVGGMASVKQERILNKGPEIVIATPGRLWELVQLGNSHLAQINDIKYLAIDETDRMLEKGHFEELHELLQRLNTDNQKMQQRQNFVFSATLTLVHELPNYLKTKFKFKKLNKMNSEQKLNKVIDLLGITNPKIVDLCSKTGAGTSTTLTECRITCAFEEKDYYVYYFLQRHPGRTLIFCNSIGCVRRLTNLLGLLDCHVLPLHASMQQKQRFKNLERFRDNPQGILIATDVAARGLDIPQIEHVLHYQTPRTSEGYIHRSGRTARATREGITILLMEPSELQNYVKLCKTLGKEKDLPIFPVQDNFLNAVKQRVNLARELDKLDLDIRKTNSENGWLEKAAQEMDMIIDCSEKFDKTEMGANKKIANLKRKQLTSILAKPIFPKGFTGKYPLSCGELTLPFIENKEVKEKAIELMKNEIEKITKEKRKNIPLYKPKKNKLGKWEGNKGFKNKKRSK